MGRAWWRWGTPALALIVAAAAGFWWWDSQRTLPEAGPFEAEGVVLERLRVERLPPEARGRVPRRGGVSGDWRLRSASASVVIGAGGPGAERAARCGALLDATVQGVVEDRLEELRTWLELEGQPVRLRCREVAAELNGGPPAVLVRFEPPLHDVELSTRVSLDPTRDWVKVDTTLENHRGEALRSVSLGDRVRWPGGAPYAPGVGYVEGSLRSSAIWLGRSLPRSSYALSYLEGAVDIDFRSDHVGPTEQVATRTVVEVPPGGAVTLRRVLAMARGDLAAAVASALHATGRSTGQVTGKVQPAVPDARVELRAKSGTPQVEARPDAEGNFALKFLPGSYDLVLHAPGGRHVEPVQLSAEGHETVELLAPSAGMLRISVVDERRQPMPARVALYGRYPTPKPHLTSEQRASGTHNVAYAGKDGELALQLPPGTYLVRVTRGPEYGVFREEVTIEAEQGRSLRVTLPQLVSTPGWISADLHLHSAPSFDSSVTLEDRVTSLAAEGVELAVATDHNHVTSYDPALKARGLADKLRGVVGVEITTTQWGHFNAYPYPLTERAPVAEDASPLEIFQDARALAPNAVLQVNHPHMADIGYFTHLQQTPGLAPRGEPGFSFDFDTLELINGFELEDPVLMEKNVRSWFELLNWGYAYTAVGNSDSHSLVFQWAGYPRTYLQVDDDRPSAVSDAALVEALLRGRAQVSNGIFAEVRLDGAGRPGDLVTLEGEQALLELSARAPDYVDVRRAEVWVNGELVRKLELPAPRGAARVYGVRETLTFERDSWVVVIVRGDRPLAETYPEGRGTPFVITNPIFVDFDGDGGFHPPHELPPGGGLAPVQAGYGGASAPHGEHPHGEGDAHEHAGTRLPFERSVPEGDGSAGAPGSAAQDGAAR